MPVICDPNNFDKSANFLAALTELDVYTAKLGFEMPDIHIPATTGPQKFSVGSAKTFGMYWPTTPSRPWQLKPTVMVNVLKSRKPAIEPVRSWAFTGYKTDLTAAGILSHEFGHFYDEQRGMLTIQRVHYSKMRELWEKEGCVSSYCPIVGEWFAETFRVWFLNPNLLELAKPRTAEYMLELGFPKSHELPWQEVLRHAHPKWHSAAENFIKTGTKQNRPKRRKKVT